MSIGAGVSSRSQIKTRKVLETAAGQSAVVAQATGEKEHPDVATAVSPPAVSTLASSEDQNESTHEPKHPLVYIE